MKCILFLQTNRSFEAHLDFEPVSLGDSEGHRIYSEMDTGSVSNGSKSPGRFRVRFRPGTEPFQWVLPHENPDRCHWAGFTTKNPALQVHNFRSN